MSDHGEVGMVPEDEKMPWAEISVSKRMLEIFWEDGGRSEKMKVLRKVYIVRIDAR